MARKRRQTSPSGVYHWICRGIHKKEIFHHPKDYQFFKDLLGEYKTSFGIAIYHYCLMTNHTHLLIKSDSLGAMAKFSQLVQRRYAYYYCGSYKWVGSVFQPGYKSIPVDQDAYLLECGRYIERNPLKAGIVQDPTEYPYSSYGHYSGGEVDELIDPSPAYLGLANREDDRIAIYTEYVTQDRQQDTMPATSALEA